MTTTAPTTDAATHATRTQLDRALAALRHSLRALTPTIGIAPDGHTAAQVATLAGQTAQCARDCASIIDQIDDMTT